MHHDVDSAHVKRSQNIHSYHVHTNVQHTYIVYAYVRTDIQACTHTCTHARTHTQIYTPGDWHKNLPSSHKSMKSETIWSFLNMRGVANKKGQYQHRFLKMTTINFAACFVHNIFDKKLECIPGSCNYLATNSPPPQAQHASSAMLPAFAREVPNSTQRAPCWGSLALAN